MQTTENVTAKCGKNQSVQPGRGGRWFGLAAADVGRILLGVVPLLALGAYAAGQIGARIDRIDDGLKREIVNRRAHVNEKAGRVRAELQSHYAPVIVRIVRLEETARRQSELIPVLSTKVDSLAGQVGRIDANVEAIRGAVTSWMAGGGKRTDRLRPAKRPPRNSARLQ